MDSDLKSKIGLLKKASIFSLLKEKELKVVAKYSEYRTFRKGQALFSEGGSGDELFVVEDGEILISKQTIENVERDVARFIAGECFGELDLFERAPRTATATAEKDSRLLIFPMKGIEFTDVLQNHPEISAHILHTLLAIIAGRIRRTNRIISEKSQWIQDLRKQILNDKLTGLYNRSYLDEDLRELLSEHNQTSLLIIKPDNFKIINDKYGHDAGDNTLRLMADTVKSSLREGDIPVRYRGDEFAVILPDTDKNYAIGFSDKLKSALNMIDLREILMAADFRITTSIGIAVYPYHSDDHITLAKKAYEKMLEARNSGGDKILCY
jgi:diguanylate cyclase